jgi:hypothetical protein
MAQELISIWGVRVGTVERNESIRHSLAFDLRDVDLHDGAIVSAALELPGSVTRDARAVELSDPANRVRYGASRDGQQSHIRYIDLSATAIRDLQGAAGGFFVVDVEIDGDAVEPLCLAGTGEEQLMLVAIAEMSHGVAAAA